MTKTLFFYLTVLNSYASSIMVGSQRCDDLGFLMNYEACGKGPWRLCRAKDQVQGQGHADVDPEAPKDISSLTQSQYCIIVLGLARRPGSL